MHIAERDDNRQDPGLLGVQAGSEESCDLAAQWARMLRVPLLKERPQSTGVVLLAAVPGALELISTASSPKPLLIDFLYPPNRRRLSTISTRRDPLVKAVGLHRRRELTVIDATAGLGRDGLTLAWLGARVTWIESSPSLLVLLHQAIERAQQYGEPHLVETAQRLGLTPGRAESLLSRLAAADVVYLDPMYPPESMRGGAGKEAQTLRALLGAPDQECEQLLLEPALAKALRRVVVKRPQRAPPLANLPPAREMRGKSIRFDIYEGRQLHGRN